MTQNSLLGCLFIACVFSFGFAAAADIEVAMGPCTEKNYIGSFPKGGTCDYLGCYPEGAGCSYLGCWLPGGGCNYNGCWPAGGSCNYNGCTSRGECDYNGCPDKISGEKIKFTCDLPVETPSNLSPNERIEKELNEVNEKIAKLQKDLPFALLTESMACGFTWLQCNKAFDSKIDECHSKINASSGYDKVNNCLAAARKISFDCAKAHLDCLSRLKR